MKAVRIPDRLGKLWFICPKDDAAGAYQGLPGQAAGSPVGGIVPDRQPAESGVSQPNAPCPAGQSKADEMEENITHRDSAYPSGAAQKPVAQRGCKKVTRLPSWRRRRDAIRRSQADLDPSALPETSDTTEGAPAVRGGGHTHTGSRAGGRPARDDVGEGSNGGLDSDGGRGDGGSGGLPQLTHPEAGGPRESAAAAAAAMFLGSCGGGSEEEGEFEILATQVTQALP